MHHQNQEEVTQQVGYNDLPDTTSGQMTANVWHSQVQSTFLLYVTKIPPVCCIISYKNPARDETYLHSQEAWLLCDFK